MSNTTPDQEVWAIEYSARQKQFHIQSAATIQYAGEDWQRIGTIRGTVHDANKFCDQYRDANP